MRIANNQYMLRELKADNKDWFSPQNKRFFGDIGYMFYYSQSGEAFLARSTHQWSDMFGEPKKIFYRLNKLEQKEGGNYRIGELLDEQFESLTELKNWLKRS